MNDIKHMISELDKLLRKIKEVKQELENFNPVVELDIQAVTKKTKPRSCTEPVSSVEVELTLDDSLEAVLRRSLKKRGIIAEITPVSELPLADIKDARGLPPFTCGYIETKQGHPIYYVSMGGTALPYSTLRGIERYIEGISESSILSINYVYKKFKENNVN